MLKVVRNGRGMVVNVLLPKLDNSYGENLLVKWTWKA